MRTSAVQPSKSKNRLRSAGALLAGLAVGVVLSVGTDLLMYALGILPRPGQPTADVPLLFATTYRTIYGILASYLAARFAPSRPMGHALALGVMGLAASVAGAVATWNRQPSLGPHWYPVALVVLAIPSAWVGGKLRMCQVAAS